MIHILIIYNSILLFILLFLLFFVVAIITIIADITSVWCNLPGNTFSDMFIDKFDNLSLWIVYPKRNDFVIKL